MSSRIGGYGQKDCPNAAASFRSRLASTARTAPPTLDDRLMLPVNEIFETIQGEATFTGTPSVFVRLQGCPVACPWCDTKHTWEVAQADQVPAPAMLAKTEDGPAWALMTDQQILEEVLRYRAGHVVITGGEPALYDLRELSRLLLDRCYSVQVETSGTHRLAVDPEVWVTVSPKVGMHGGYVVLPEMIERANEIKHPVSKLRDVENLQTVLGDGRSGRTVWLQPISQSAAATRTCIEQATERGWRVSVQVHKYLDVR
jgi:7-carboxy-7-deazaguanine synthase